MQVVEKIKLYIISLGLNTSYNTVLDISSVDFKEIPDENKKNIVLAITHYDAVQTQFKKWETDNKRKKFADQIFPTIEVQPPKDDVIEYSDSW